MILIFSFVSLATTCSYCYAQAVETFREWVNHQNADGDTPLHCLVRRNNLRKKAKVLIRAGANLDLLNRAGQSARQIAAVSGGERRRGELEKAEKSGCIVM